MTLILMLILLILFNIPSLTLEKNLSYKLVSVKNDTCFVSIKRAKIPKICKSHNILIYDYLFKNSLPKPIDDIYFKLNHIETTPKSNIFELHITNLWHRKIRIFYLYSDKNIYIELATKEINVKDYGIYKFIRLNQLYDSKVDVVFHSNYHPDLLYVRLKFPKNTQNAEVRTFKMTSKRMDDFTFYKYDKDHEVNSYKIFINKNYN